ncbi:MAG: nuclease [Desulfuromonas sp.]|nr:MAG: nuclease [Desulfuromonas sp.]
MILKTADEKTTQIEELQRLLASAPAAVAPRIKQELRNLQAGIKGENEAAYHIDFHLKDSKNTAVIHDLRLEFNGRVAQIDHLLLHRSMILFVLETKSFHAGIKIGDDGQFMNWNNFNKNYEGMPSPLAQNERHITVLKDLASFIEWPTRMGLKLTPTFESFVLVSSQARIDRPKKFDTKQVIKVDDFITALDSSLESRGVVEVFGAAAKFVSSETIHELGRRIVRRHKPLVPDYAAKFGLTDLKPQHLPPSSEIRETEASYGDGKACGKCGSSQVQILYGKYGYYFKCSACQGNTAIKLQCGQDGHKVRLRKDGANFYQECLECGTSVLYFRNP